MISLNCQSINAKFDKLKLFVTEMNTHETISVICIQETWGHNGIDMDFFPFQIIHWLMKIDG